MFSYLLNSVVKNHDDNVVVPKGERVRADGRDHDGGHGGVDHACSGRHGVGGTSRGRGHNQTVSLNKISL